ncbi:MAG: flagellar motor protein MotB, partial [Mariprofundaceae bacterium]
VLPLTKNEVRVRLNEAILFESGSAELPASAALLMQKLGKMLNRPEINQVVIQGYTDDTPSSGSYPDNWQLSAARAMSVFRHFAALGMAKGRMVVQGMGSTHLIRDELGIVDISRSRRVELLIRFRPVTDDSSEIKGVHGAAVQRPATAGN